MKAHRKPGALLHRALHHYWLPAIFACLAAILNTLSGLRLWRNAEFLLSLFCFGCILALLLSAACRALFGSGKKGLWAAVIGSTLGFAAGCLAQNEMFVQAGILGAGGCFLAFALCRGPYFSYRLNRCIGWGAISLGISSIAYFSLNLIYAAISGLIIEAAPEVLLSVQYVYLSFCYLLVFPLLFLGGTDETQPGDNEKTGFQKLNCWVLLPFGLTLFGVLILYAGKILLSWEMPVGLMNPFSLVALSFYVFFHLTLDGSENKLSQLFTKWGGFLMLPILIAQQIGVGIRVSAYGLTQGRVLGIAWTALCLAVVISGLLRKKAKWFFPALGVLLLLLFVSPINAETIARINQETRLEAALRRNDMLDADGSIRPGTDVSFEDRILIYDTVQYLSTARAPENSFTGNVKQQFNQLAQSQSTSGIWSDASLAHQLFGFTRPQERIKDLFLTFSTTLSTQEIDVRGYAHAKRFSASEAIDFPVSSLRDGVLPDTLFIRVDGETVDIAPLLSEFSETTPPQRTDERTFALAKDVFPLPSGRELHLCSIRLIAYSYDENASLSLTGWILTPEE